MKTVLVSIVIPYREINGEQEIWMQKRESEDELSGKLEFPGGKIEKSETPIMAACREVKEEVGVDIDNAKLELATIYNNKFKDKIISLYVFVLRKELGFESKALMGGWFNLKDRESFWADIPPANQEFLIDVLKAVKSSA